MNIIQQVNVRSIHVRGSSHVGITSTNKRMATCKYVTSDVKIIYNNAAWILDSKSTYHICFNPNQFQKLIKIKPIKVKFPNGNTTIVDYAGSIILSSKMKLHKCVIFATIFF